MNRDEIKEIQEALRTLSFYDAQLYPLHVDGIYGDETTMAVRIFQTLSGLEPTGNVDRATWEELRDGVKDARGITPIPLRVFEENTFTVNPGDSTDIVPVIQWILNQIATYYVNLNTVNINGIYDERTVRQIQTIQRLHRMEADGIIDVATWNLLTTLYHQRGDTAKR